jgi:hypothetical protein
MDKKPLLSGWNSNEVAKWASQFLLQQHSLQFVNRSDKFEGEGKKGSDIAYQKSTLKMSIV